PVSFDLLTLRDAIGAEFPMDWTSLKVSVGGEEVPYQIDDVDLNGRLSAGDQLGFLATGPATIEIADAPGEGASYEPALTVEGGPGRHHVLARRGLRRRGAGARPGAHRGL